MMTHDFYRFFLGFFEKASRCQAVGDSFARSARGTPLGRSGSDGNSRTCRSSPAVSLAERTHVAMPRAEVRHCSAIGFCYKTRFPTITNLPSST